MKKRLLSILLALCMVLALLPVTVQATETTGKCGDNVTWTYNNGTLTIQGTGDMYDYDLDYDEGTPWHDYWDTIYTVVIGDGVTSIGECVFQHCTSLTSVTIGNSVTSIGGDAFWNCLSLTSVSISVSVTTIRSRAFAHCGWPMDVYYGGSEEQWKQIDIDSMDEDSVALGYNALFEATIHYNSIGPAPSTSSSISVTVDGTAVTWTDAAPFIDANSRTMVPLRAVADAMGLDVNWDGSAREAVFTNGSKTIYFPIDSNTARTSDGGAVQMDTAAVIVNERTYAPIRYLAEYFGYEVGWDAATRTVTIK